VESIAVPRHTNLPLDSKAARSSAFQPNYLVPTQYLLEHRTITTKGVHFNAKCAPSRSVWSRATTLLYWPPHSFVGWERTQRSEARTRMASARSPTPRRSKTIEVAVVNEKILMIVSYSCVSSGSFTIRVSFSSRVLSLLLSFCFHSLPTAIAM
jgi:hypothetical protein